MNRWLLPALAFLGLLGCQNPYTGLGNALDLEAPRVTITSHKNMDYVGAFFTLEGKAEDNLKPTGVSLTLRGAGLETSLSAQLSDTGEWKAEFPGAGSDWESSGLPDGEYQVRATVTDAAGNTSQASVATLTVVVDATSPSALISAPALKPLTYLEALWPGETRDFDTVELMQNGTIRLRGVSEENYRLSSLVVEIIHQDETVALRSLSVDRALPEDMQGTIWNWTWDLDSSTLKPGGVDLDPTRRYYFRVKVTVRDMNPDNPATIFEASSPQEAGYFVVYPRADLPWSLVQSHSAGETLQPGAVLSGNSWDDDGLGGIYALIQRASEPEPDTGAYKSWKTEALNSKTSKVYSSLGLEPRMYTWSLQAPVDPGSYRLYLRTEDRNRTPDLGYRVLEFTVADQNAPMTVITSPENQGVVPATGKGSFTVTGYSYDNNQVAEMKMAWVPKGISPAELLAGNHWSKAAGPSAVTLDSTGIKIWDLSSRLVAAGLDADLPTPGSGGRLRWNWTADFHVENDFVVSGKPEYADRQLVFYTRDTASNVTYTRLTLAGERDAPTSLTVATPANDGDYLRAFADPYENITGTVADGSWISSLTITWVEGKVTRVLKPDSPTATWSWSLSSKVFADAKALGETSVSFLGSNNLQFTVEDVYGNKAFASRYFVVDSAVPVVTKVTSTEPNSYYGVGKILDLAVEFSKPVNVAGTGTASLTLNSGGTAEYISGSGTANLVFRYTVGAGHNAPRLNYPGTDSLALSGTLTFKDSAGNNALLTLPDPSSLGALGQLKNIIIDTAAPAVTSLDTSHGKTHSGAGTQVSLQVTFNDVVTVSGNPEITLNSGAGAKALYSSGSGTGILTFNYLVGAGENSSALDASGTGALTGTIQDRAGNPAVLTLGIPSSLGSKSLKVDTAAPASPSVSGLVAGTYNSDRSFTISGEAGAEFRYSLNGGLDWSAWTGTGSGGISQAADSLGIYQFIAQQRDRAGNVSPGQGPIQITLDKVQPRVTNVTSDNANGIYTDGNSMVIKVSFDKVVTVAGVGTPTLSLNSAASAALSGGAGSSSLHFSYTVASGQNVADLDYTATSALALNGGTIRDSLGNDALLILPTPGLAGSLAFNRDFVIDTAPPTISSISWTSHVNAEADSVSTNVSTSAKIRLQFSEPVSKATGTITLYRKYRTFPVIMTITEYNQYTSLMDAAEIARLNKCYSLVTNGAVNGTPNSMGVYVLNYNLDPILTPSDPSSSNGEDALGMLWLFHKIGYNKIEMDIQSTQVSVSGSVVEIRPFVGLRPGIHYYLNIPSGSFKDAAGRTYAGVSDENTISFVTGPVATPIIRVNRVSGHGTTQFPQSAYKLSSETFGSVSRRTENGLETNSSSPALPAIPSDPIETSSEYTGPVTIGSNSETSGYIQRIKAKSFHPNLSGSVIKEDIAFKTILIADGDVSSGDNTRTNIWFRGSNNSGGPTTAPGFPLRWEEDQFTHIRLGKNNSNKWTWITWEIYTSTQFKALRGDSPDGDGKSGPYSFRWMTGLNATVNPGGVVTTVPGWEANLQFRPGSQGITFFVKKSLNFTKIHYWGMTWIKSGYGEYSNSSSPYVTLQEYNAHWLKYTLYNVNSVNLLFGDDDINPKTLDLSRSYSGPGVDSWYYDGAWSSTPP